MNNKILFIIYLLLSGVIGFYFGGANGIWYFIFSAFIGAAVFFGRPAQTSELKISRYFLAVPLAIFLFSRLLPFQLYGPQPLGYDTGFYKYSLSQERAGSLGGLKLAATESAGSRIIYQILLKIGLSDAAIMYGFYIIIGALIGLMVYLLAKSYFGETAALLSLFAYSISFVQYLAFWNMFWKNAVGLFLTLTAFYLMEKKRLAYKLLSLPLIGAAFITHKTSAFLLFLTLTVWLGMQKNKIKYYFLPLVFIGAGIVAWYNRETAVYLWDQYRSGFSAYYDFFSVKEGIFIEGREYLDTRYAFFYLPFGLITILHLVKNKKISQVLIFSLLSAALIAIKFIFYKRIFIFFDIALLIFFGWAFSRFIEKIGALTSENYRRWFMYILLLLPAVLFFVSVVNQKPLISREEMRIIEQAKDYYPGWRLFTYDSYYTPWLYGFSGHKIISPGWGDDQWTLGRWEEFWNADQETKRTMLGDFKPPFLVYDAGGEFFEPAASACFEKINNNLYIFSCK